MAAIRVNDNSPILTGIIWGKIIDELITGTTDATSVFIRAA